MNQLSGQEDPVHLSRLPREVATGAEVVIRRSDVPVARVLRREPGRTVFRIHKRRFLVPKDFGAPAGQRCGGVRNSASPTSSGGNTT